MMALAVPAGAAAPNGNDAYKLAPGDRLTVTVIGQTELSGEYPLDDDGNIVFPLVGPVMVADLTIAECQRRLVERLADGILVNPSVFVRASELRPIQVLGDVRNPGSYPFRFGFMVKSAIAQAGGVGTPDRGASVSDLLIADERVRTLGVTRLGLLVRQARLLAQLDGAKMFTPPSGLATDPGGDAAKIIAEESEVLRMESAALERQLTLVRSQKPQLLSEEEALGGQINSGKKQLDLVQIELDKYNQVTDRGFGNSHTALELKIAVENKQSDIWRLEAERSRVRMNIMGFDVRLSEAETSRKKQILTELQDVRQRLHESEVALPSAREIRSSMLRQVGGVIGFPEIRNMQVTRLRDGKVSTVDVSETILLEPGDILEIRAQRPGNRQTSTASTIGDAPFPTSNKPAVFVQQ